MSKIWIVNDFESVNGFLGQAVKSRAVSFAVYLSKLGHDVNYWTSAFEHSRKRDYSEFSKIQDLCASQFNIMCIHICILSIPKM